MAAIMNHDAQAESMALECKSCLLGQAMRTAREAGLSEKDQTDVVQQTARWMSFPEDTSHSPQRLGRMTTDLVTLISKFPTDFDIYREPKAMSNRLAQTHTASLREAIVASEDPLAMAIRIATAGNVIDFGAKDHATMDIEAELRTVTSQPFERFDLEAFRSRLLTAKSLLYICDNAGEIVFDGLLMEALSNLHPSLAIKAAFRDKPILNDATVEDAKSVGLDRFADLISSGSHLAGTDLPECTPEFRHHYETADLILSKGQGNYSSLVREADERVYFLFRTKCAPTARRSGTTLGNLQVIQGTRIPSKQVD